MPNAQCPMPNAQCPMHVGYLMLLRKAIYNSDFSPTVSLFLPILTKVKFLS